jgi:copper transport protein
MSVFPRVFFRTVCGLFALVAVVLWASPAAAHAVLVESDPVNGSALAEAPRTAVLTFSEDIAARFSSARLMDSSGHVLGRARSAAGADRLTLELPPLAVGAYGIAWKVLAEDDAHTTEGVVLFTVGAVPATAAGPAGVPGPAPLDVALRWVRLCLLAGLVGALAVAGLVLGGPVAGLVPGRLVGGLVQARVVPPVPPSWAAGARRRLVTAAGVCAALGVAADMIELAGKPLDTQWGRLWIARTVALAVLAACAFTRRSALVCVVAVGVVVSAEAWSGHAAALGGLAVAADAVHILTACLWLGSVAALGVLLAAPSGQGLALVRAYRIPFARLALTGAALVAVTGLVHAALQLGSPGALLDSPYGRTLLVKGGIVAVVAALGLANARRLRPSRRLVAVEAAVGAVLLLAAGALAETSPSRSPAVAPAVARSRSAIVKDLVVDVSVTPNRAGVNAFTVTAASSRRPAPAPIDGVALLLPEGGTVLRQVQPGRYFGTGSLKLLGPVRLTVVVYRAGARLEVPMTWSVG